MNTPSHPIGALDIEASPADVMAVAPTLLGDPVERRGRPAGLRWRSRLRSRWRHPLERDARQVRSHDDVCDEFFSVRLDPLRVCSCANVAGPNLSLAPAQQAQPELVCRLIDGTGLRGRERIRLLDDRALVDGRGVDRIAPVGMFEPLGRDRLAGCFATLHRLLRPAGLLLGHGIAAGGLDNPGLGAGGGRWLSRCQMLSARPDDRATTGRPWAARSDCPVTRAQMGA